MKLNIKNTARLTTACLIMCLATTTWASDYDTHWAKQAITRWSTNQIVKGQAEGIFAPNAPVTRAELATFIDRLFTITPQPVAIDYKDVKSNEWYTEAIHSVASHGYMYVSGDTFGPNDYATREEVAYAMTKAYNLQPNQTGQQQFTDEAHISEWAKDSVYTLAQYGYIKGNPDGSFNPQGKITRAELVTIIDNMTHNYIRESDTYTQVRPGNLIINAKDVTLSNVTVAGNLYITDAAAGSTITLQDVEVKGRIYVSSDDVKLEGDYRQQAPMNITEAAVVIQGVRVPVQVEDTTITINLNDLLDSTTESDIMEGLIISTDVQGAYLTGYSGGKLMTNTQYSFRQADYQLGMIEEMLAQVTSQSTTLKDLAETFGVTPDTIFFLLSDQGDISISHMISQYEDINRLATQYIGSSLPTAFSFQRQLHYGEEVPITIMIKLEMK